MEYFFPAASLLWCCAFGNTLSLHGHSSCLSGWKGGVSSKSLALTWPRNTTSSPCPFRPRGGNAFQLLQTMANIKLLSQLLELAKYIIRHHDFLYMTSDQGTHFTTKVRRQAHAHRISCRYLVRSKRSHRRLSGTAYGRPICGTNWETAL